MKRVFSLLVSGLLMGIWVGPARAAEGSTLANNALVIATVYPGSTADAADEFIVLHNQVNQELNLKGYALEYKAATGKSWYKKAHVDTDLVVGAHQDVTIATKRDAQIELTSGLAQSGGNLRLVNADDSAVDQVAWGNGDSPEANAASAPKAGEALERSCDESSGTCIDSQDNRQDFRIAIVDSNTDSDAGSKVGAAPDQAVEDAQQIEITELLPDPASPLSDGKDEYIELYNAGGAVASLNGWKLIDAAGHSAKLDGVSIPANSYIVLYSATTKLSLNNSGDTISLVRPDGNVVMTTPNYGSSKIGRSYGVTPEGWGWLVRPTPGVVNVGLSVENEEVSATSSKAKKVSSKSAKAKSASKSKSPKVAKAAAAAKDAASTSSEPGGVDQPVPWVWLVAGLGVFAVGYGVYEYRPEIISAIDRVRAKLAARR